MLAIVLGAPRSEFDDGVGFLIVLLVIAAIVAFANHSFK